jgi:thiamine biosynthesis lipoprotein
MDQRTKNLVAILFVLSLLFGCASQVQPVDQPNKLCEVQFKIPSMGSIFEVQLLQSCAESNLNQLSPEILARLKSIEEKLSLYQADSEVSKLNRFGRLENPSDIFLENLRLSLEANKFSSGAFNPLVRPWVNPPWHATLPNVKALDVSKIKASPKEIHFTQKNMGLTFDGIAKGYALDQIADLFKQAAIKNYLLNFSGNMKWAGHRLDGGPWKIAIWNPVKKQIIEVPPQEAGCISSSGNEHLGFHIFDPRTQKWVGDFAAASIVMPFSADCGARSDSLSTTLFILGPKQSEKLLIRHFPGAYGYFILPSGNHLNTLHK